MAKKMCFYGDYDARNVRPEKSRDLGDLQHFLSTITSGKFYVDPEILSPQVKWGQIVIWSEKKPYS